MPETTIFFDREDEARLISTIFREGGRLVADRHRTAAYQEITSWDGFEAARKQQRLFFVLHGSFEKWPLTLFRCKGGYHEGTYYVMQRWGGPTVDISFGVQLEKEGKKWISLGGISYYPSYKNTVTMEREMEPAPEELVAFYRMIVKELKKDGKVIQDASGRKYLIGPHTLGGLKEGTLAIDGLKVDWNMV